MKKTKKALCLIIVFFMVFGSLPGGWENPVLEEALAAGNENPSLENNTEDVFAALGFDTGTLPEGYDPETTGNPFGREKTTGNQVFEVLMATSGGTKLYGNNDNSISPSSLGDYSIGGASMPQVKLFSAATGDFDGDGLPGEVAYVGIERQYFGVSTKAPLILYVYDSATNTYSSALTIGNISPYYTISGNASQRENQTKVDASWQNLLQITSGDYDGDGISEIAVYVADSGNSRVDIYKYQKTSDAEENAWLTIGNWSRAWSYAVSAAQYAVPNMVSLISGDFNRDGVDDLGISYGRAVYNVKASNFVILFPLLQSYNYTGLCLESEASKARILWGSTSGMLQKNSPLDLGSEVFGNLIRASLAFGDVDGDGTKDLVMAGQPLDDKNANYQRAVGFYNYDEEAGLVLTTSQLLKVVDTENQTIPTYDSDGNPTGDTTMTNSKNGYDTKYLSTPVMRCNTAVVTPDRSSYTYIYVDSVLCKYLNQSLSIAYELDDDTSCDGGNNNITLPWAGSNDNSYLSMNAYNNFWSYSYCEYGAVFGDINGSGNQILLTNYMGTSGIINYVQNGEYNQNNPPDYRGSFKGFNILYKDNNAIGINAKNILSNTLSETEPYVTPIPVSITMPDTDCDTTIIEYSGIHYLTYSDPKVLAVIAAAPYFNDVDIISDYDYAWQNTTSFSKISGSGDGSLVSVDFEIGGYFEGDYTIAGASVNIQLQAGFTMEWEKETTTSREYTLTFETSQDEDAVAFYCIPTECYVYYVYVPDGMGGYTKTTDIISNSFSPAFQILSLDYYESIQGDYDALPQIAGTAITSTPGYPSTYPSSTSGYNVLSQWNQDPAGVSFGNGAITQEIEVTTEETNTYNFGANLEFRAGAGGEGWSSLIQSGAHVKAGAYFSINPAGGFSKIDLSGTSISGTVANMPTEFKDFGYYYSWKIFSYKYTFADGTSVPVVSYIVNDVSEPPRLPLDFKQDYEGSTSDMNFLTWTYTGSVRDFYLYRYGDFPEGSGLQLIAAINAGDPSHYRLINGKKEFYYKDENLSPYTEYKYCIQVERSSPVPPLSAPSAYLVARTKAAVGNPVLTVAESDGTNDGRLLVYPDKNAYLTTGVTGPEGQLSTNYYTSVLYQWQKQIDGKWTDLDNETSRTLTFASAGVSSAGVYRCRVNSITKESATYITSYTEAVTVSHSKRATHISEIWAHDSASSGVELYAKVVNDHADSAAIPGGTVLFTLISGSTGICYQYVEPLDSNGVANPIIDETLPEGIYNVYAYYSGSYVFKPSEAESLYLADLGSGWAIDNPSSMTYGDGGSFTFLSVSKIGGVTSSIPRNASEIFLYKADTAQVISLPDAATITNGAEVVLGRNYTYKTEDGNVWFFTATRSAEHVELEDKYVYYDRTPVLGYITLTGSTGVYKLEDNTPAGGYILQMTADDGSGGILGSAWASFIVNRRPVILQLPNRVGNEGVNESLPAIGELSVISGSFASCDYTDGQLNTSIADTLVHITYTNTAGKTFNNTSVDDTCGYYTTSFPTTSTLLDNYTLSFLGGSVSILGKTYNLILGARPFENADVGTVYLVSPDYDYTRSPLIYDSGTNSYSSTDVSMNYQAGTRVIFYAVPDSGYEVYDWYVGGVAQNTKATSLPIVMYAQNTRVEVQFAVKQSTLVYGTAGDADGGTLICSDSSLSNGSILLAGSKLTFTAVANEGYHFKEWRYTETGLGTAYDNEDQGKNSSVFNFIMPTQSCTLYAVFERDFYTLTLNDLSGKGGLIAWYYSSPADYAAGEKTWVKGSSALIKGDTQITIQPATGFQLDDERAYVSEGTQGIADYIAGTYTLSIKENTVVTCKTRQLNFNVTVNFNLSNTTSQPEEAVIEVSTAGSDHVFSYDDGTTFQLTDLAGGSPLTFFGSCAHYYDLEGWENSLISPLTGIKADDLADEGLSSWQSLAVTVADGGTVERDSIYKYTYEEGGSTITCFFKATETGKVYLDGNEIHVIASGNSYEIEELSSDMEITLYLTEKPVHTVTLSDISNGTYDYSLPAGATESPTSSGSVITLHQGDNLAITVTPVSGKTVTYWLVSYKPEETLLTSKYRATSMTYTLEDIGYDYTVTSEFAASIYNTVSWSAINSAVTGITLTPVDGSLSSVASGGNFNFKLEGASSTLSLIDKVYANGYEFTAAGNIQAGSEYKYNNATHVYTISNIRENQVITLTFKEIGLKVNGTDISAFSGTGWNYNSGTQVLTLTSGSRVLSGSNSQTYAPNLTILLDTGAGTVTFENLNVSSSAPGYLVSSKRTTGITVTAAGSNTFTLNANNTASSAILLHTVGDLTIRGTGSLTLNVNRDSAATSMKAVYCGGELLITGNINMTLNAPKPSSGSSFYDRNIGIRCVKFTIGVKDSETISPSLKIYMYGADGKTLDQNYNSVGIITEGGIMTAWGGKLLICAYNGLYAPGHYIYNYGGFTEINSVGGAIRDARHAYWLVDYSPEEALKKSGFLACYGESDTDFFAKTFGENEEILLDGYDFWDAFLSIFGLDADEGNPLTSKYLYIASATDSTPGITVKVTESVPDDDDIVAEGTIELSTGSLGEGTFYYYNDSGNLNKIEEDDLSPNYLDKQFYAKYDKGMLSLQKYKLDVESVDLTKDDGYVSNEPPSSFISTPIIPAMPYHRVSPDFWYHYYNGDENTPEYLYFTPSEEGWVSTSINDYSSDTVTLYINPSISEYTDNDDGENDDENHDDYTNALSYTLSGVDSGLKIEALIAESLTLEGLTAASLSVNEDCQTFEIYGDNYLAGTTKDEGVLIFNTDSLSILSDGTGTLSAINSYTGSGSDKSYGIKFNSPDFEFLVLSDVKALSAYGKTEGIHADNTFKVSYYDDVLSDSLGVYGYGWLADSGFSSAVAAVQKGSLVGQYEINDIKTPYVRYYRTTTDAASEKAFDYDKNPAGTSILTTKVYCPAIVGKNHMFVSLQLWNDTSSVTLVEDTDYEWAQTTANGINIASGTLTLKTDSGSALSDLDVGEYTLRVNFYDENPYDATYYTLDIPLSVRDSLSSEKNELFINPTVKNLSKGGSFTFTTSFTGTTPKTYKWYLDDVLIDDAVSPSYKLTAASNMEFRSYTLKAEAYETDTAAEPMDTATAAITIVPKAESILITCPTETPSGDGTYTIYHNTQDTWDFDAEATLDNNTTSSDVTWSLWGAQMRFTTINSSTGVLTIAKSETGTGGILKLTATHTNAAGTSLSKTVDIYLSTDAYVAYSNADDDNGDITSVFYGEAQNNIPPAGAWIPAGSIVTALASPYDDYNVKAWNVTNDGVSIDGSLLTISGDGKTLAFTAGPMGNYHITAEYVNKYNFAIEYSSGANGSLTAAKDGIILKSGNTVPINSTVTFTATPDTYYMVKGWTLDGLPYEENPGTPYKGTTLTLDNITENHNVTVEYEGIPLTVTYIAGINTEDTSSPNGNLVLFYNGTLVSSDPVAGGDYSLTYEDEVPAMGEVNILANPDKGYLVKCWYIWNGTTYTAVNSSSEVANYYVPAITGNLKVKVEFERIPAYNVTVSSNSYQNGGGTVASGIQSISISDSMIISVKNHGNLTLLATPDAGSYLYEWRVKGADYVTEGNSVTLINITGDATAAAVFRKVFYDVNLESGVGGTMTASYSLAADASSGSIDDGGSASIKAGSEVIVSIYPDMDYTIDTLTVNGEPAEFDISGDEGSYDYTYIIDKLLEDTDISVTFKECIYYYVIAPEDSNFDILISEAEYPGGSAKAGFVTDGFSYGGGSKANILQGSTATLTFTPASGTTDDIDYSTYVKTSALEDAVEEILEDNSSDASYTIFLDGSSYVVMIENIDTDLDFSEMDNVFALKTDDADEYTVTFDENGNGTIAAYFDGIQLVSGAQVPEGSTIVFKLTPLDHYSLTELENNSDDVLSDVNFKGNIGTYTIDVTDDIDLRASFEIAEYLVSIIKVGTGNGTLAVEADEITLSKDGYLPVGSQVSITATPNAGSDFNCMSVGNTVVTDKVYTIDELDGDLEITSVFDATSKIVTYNNPANGTLTVTDSQGNYIKSGQSAEVGTILVITAIPDEHYVLYSLTAGGSSVTGNTYSVDASKTNLIEAHFKLAEVKVTISEAENGTLKAYTYDGTEIQSGSYIAVGEKIRVVATPKNQNFQLDTLKMNGDSIANGSQNTVPAKDVTISAVFKYVGDIPPYENGGGNGGGGGGGKTVIIQESEAEETFEAINVSTTDGSLTAMGSVTDSYDGIVMTVSGESFAKLADHAKAKNTGIVFKAELADLTFNNAALAYIDGMADSGNVILTVNKLNKDVLSEENRRLVGSHPVYKFSVTAGDVKVNAFGGGEVSISIPYTLKPGETPETLVVYYIDDAGTLKTIRGAYHADTGTLDFTVTHFSYYTMGNNPVDFRDVPAGSWFYKPVSFVAARGITLGLKEGIFGPEDQITRGQFIVMLMRAYDIEPDKVPKDNFADAGNAYYTNYLAAAKRLGITKGIGDNLYAPEAFISRQDIFTLLYRALDVLGELPAKVQSINLTAYADSGSIADYALTAVKSFVEAGIVSGSEGFLYPTSMSTRAQMAQVLYKLLSK